MEAVSTLLLWLWAGVIMAAVTFLSGAPEPFLGWVIAFLIMGLPMSVIMAIKE